jgi:hypothetical protein
MHECVYAIALGCIIFVCMRMSLCIHACMHGYVRSCQLSATTFDRCMYTVRVCVYVRVCIYGTCVCIRYVCVYVFPFLLSIDAFMRSACIYTPPHRLPNGTCACVRTRVYLRYVCVYTVRVCMCICFPFCFRSIRLCDLHTHRLTACQTDSPVLAHPFDR